MPSTDLPEGPPVQKKIPRRGPSKETLELGQTCLDRLAKGVQRHLLHEVLHVTPKRVDHALRVMRQQAAAAAGEPVEPRRAHRAPPRGPLQVPGEYRWQEDAACWGEPLELFFGPEGERVQEREQREQEAKAVCAGCLVQADCLDFAVGGQAPAGRWERYGVYGSLTEKERDRERRRRMKAVSNERGRQRARELREEGTAA